MARLMNEPQTIQDLLALRTIAVIGISSDPARPSYYVSAAMQSLGHRLLPINPSLEPGTLILGEQVYPSLAALPVRPDLVNVFRLPKFIPAIVDEMIALNLTALWVQQGIVNLEAAAYAEVHGIRVVMDRCLMIEARA
jgi:predicted CoA-binding protein